MISALRTVRMRPSEVLYLLYHIAKLGGLKGVRLTTAELGERLGFSQQTASRKLRELERMGYVRRERGEGVPTLFLTERGVEVLRAVYYELGRLLEGGELMVLRGRVFTGFGEGAYYVSLPGYRRQFVEKLGFEPYPGTLNLRLDRESLRLRRKLELMEGIVIGGFTHGGRRYGAVKCFRAEVEGRVRGAVLLIERTHYGPDVLEVIAPVNLREALGLRDGDWVSVSVCTNP